MADNAPPDSEPVSLNTEAEPLTVEDQIKLDNNELRKSIAKQIIKLFIIANGAVLVLIIALITIDICNGDLANRIITTQVVLALVGATTVQVGAIMVTIANYLFPKGG